MTNGKAEIGYIFSDVNYILLDANGLEILKTPFSVHSVFKYIMPLSHTSIPIQYFRQLTFPPSTM